VRVLLDENLPLDLVRELAPHDVETVLGRGWGGTKNGELLRRITGEFDVLVTMDRNLEFQQPLTKFPVGVVLILARSNRMPDLIPLVPGILAAIAAVHPGELRRVGA
jgi:hypothetical protein